MDDSIVQGLIGAGNVVLGWALGLGSAALLDRQRGKKRAAATKEAVLGELGELAFRMVGVVFSIETRRGRLDRKLLDWLKTATETYSGLNQMERLPDGFGQLLGAKDEELAAAAALMSAQSKSKFFPQEQALYAATVAAHVHDSDVGFGQKVLDVLSHLRMYNEIRESHLRYTLLTFEPGLAEQNYERIIENADNAEDQLSVTARRIVDKIVALEAEWAGD